MKPAALIIAAALAAMPAQLPADDHIELVELMGLLQMYTHKIHLSLEAGNIRLAGFYTHEMEELIDTLKEIDEYDNRPVGRLVEDRLEPAFEAFGDSLRGKGASSPARAFDALLLACNGCHKATAHEFIVVEKNPHNPYMQSFEPEP